MALAEKNLTDKVNAPKEDMLLSVINPFASAITKMKVSWLLKEIEREKAESNLGVTSARPTGTHATIFCRDEDGDDTCNEADCGYFKYTIG